MTGVNETPPLQIADGNYLRSNGLGGYHLSYSQLSSWAYCQLRKHYEDQAKIDPEAPQPEALSQTVFGSVVHYALMIMEQAHHEGREDALQLGLRTFEFYWNPENISAVAEPITVWLPRQTYGGMKERGQTAIKEIYEQNRKETAYPLALEYAFQVPIVVRGRTHTLRGMVDYLRLKKVGNKVFLLSDDYKSGKQPTYLRHNLQGTFYSYVSTTKEFWYGWPESGEDHTVETFPVEWVQDLEARLATYKRSLHNGSEHWETLPSLARKFRWVNLQEMKIADGGWRTARDYARLQLAIDAYVRQNEAETYSPSISGQTCGFCPFRQTCGGIGLPAEGDGAP